MFTPLTLESEQFLIHPFRPIDMGRRDQIVKDIYLTLSDNTTLEYIPEKRLHSIDDAESLLLSIIFNYQRNESYMHFITIKDLGVVIGMINIISPAVVKQNYKLDSHPYFIEFYLKSFAFGRGIMTDVLPAIVSNIKSQGIPRIGAAVNRENSNAVHVLKNAGFRYKSRFDLIQDLYEA